MRVLVTGATGFVGKVLVNTLATRPGAVVRAALRDMSGDTVATERVVIGTIDEATDWTSALTGVDAVVHLAARVHVLRDQTADPLAEFRRTNVSGSMRLAEDAAQAGVRRFVYLSSIKVNGSGGTYSESDRPAPEDPYGVSKLEAETGLREIAARTGMELVIIRPPLVYGPGVKGNFRSLIDAVQRGIPLPLGAVHNRRSLVALANLVDFIIICLEHQAAANETFLVSDGEDLSTTSLIRRLARAMDRPARLIPVPVSLLSAVAALLGKQTDARRLLGSLQVDISKAHRLLGWVPPVSVTEGLKQSVAVG